MTHLNDVSRSKIRNYFDIREKSNYSVSLSLSLYFHLQSICCTYILFPFAFQRLKTIENTDESGKNDCCTILQVRSHKKIYSFFFYFTRFIKSPLPKVNECSHIIATRINPILFELNIFFCHIGCRCIYFPRTFSDRLQSFWSVLFFLIKMITTNPRVKIILVFHN